MSTVLQEICARKKVHIDACKKAVSLSALEASIKTQTPPRGFAKALNSAALIQTAIIAEVKKASPSKGIIRADFDPASIAKTYEDNGAACVSVLTDEPYFQGKDEYLIAVRDTISLPVLRKDFMIDPYQIYESRALGADCILLIMAALEDSLAHELHTLAKSLKMDVLVEVHDAQELERAVILNPELIGVNNRNLKTLSVDLETSKNLADRIPEDAFKISESGISDPKDINTLKTYGYKGFLIGESLMAQADIGEALRAIL